MRWVITPAGPPSPGDRALDRAGGASLQMPAFPGHQVSSPDLLSSPHCFTDPGALIILKASEDPTSTDLFCPHADVHRWVLGTLKRKMRPRCGEVRRSAGSLQGLQSGGFCRLPEPGCCFQNFMEDGVTIRPHPSGFPLPILEPPASLHCSLVLGQLVCTSITLAWQGSEWCGGGETPGFIPTPTHSSPLPRQGGLQAVEVPWGEE